MPWKNIGDPKSLPPTHWTAGWLEIPAESGFPQTTGVCFYLGSGKVKQMEMSTVRKQRGGMLVLGSLLGYSARTWALGWCPPHSWWVFPQLSLSGETLQTQLDKCFCGDSKLHQVNNHNLQASPLSTWHLNIPLWNHSLWLSEAHGYLIMQNALLLISKLPHSL